MDSSIRPVAVAALLLSSPLAFADELERVPLFNDVHFHPTNYAQRGIRAVEYLELVGDRVGRVAMVGIPLHQKWDYFVSGDRSPEYYLLSDASRYYYSFSFVDAVIAQEYRSLTDTQKRRVDPMITGFNPTDMYAPEHIKRVAGRHAERPSLRPCGA